MTYHCEECDRVFACSAGLDACQSYHALEGELKEREREALETLTAVVIAAGDKVRVTHMDFIRAGGAELHRTELIGVGWVFETTRTPQTEIRHEATDKSDS